VLKDFTASHPTVQPAGKQLSLPFSTEEFYQDPRKATLTLYEDWLGK